MLVCQVNLDGGEGRWFMPPDYRQRPCAPWIARHDLPPGSCLPAETGLPGMSEVLRTVPRRGAGAARTANE
ncbi:MAG TPA: hypothetical protein PLJ25_07880, partial [Methanothrix sp.]|nr:hypothetical protein [Methanothrix sp.]